MKYDRSRNGNIFEKGRKQAMAIEKIGIDTMWSLNIGGIELNNIDNAKGLWYFIGSSEMQ